MPAPVRLDDILIAPAERFDVVIDFRGAEGKFFVLNNDANAPFPDGGSPVTLDRRHALHGFDTTSGSYGLRCWCQNAETPGLPRRNRPR